MRAIKIAILSAILTVGMCVGLYLIAMACNATGVSIKLVLKIAAMWLIMALVIDMLIDDKMGRGGRRR